MQLDWFYHVIKRNKNNETSFDMWLYTCLLFNYENVPNKVSSHHTYKMILIFKYLFTLKSI